jgi:hypothetical protein
MPAAGRGARPAAMSGGRYSKAPAPLRDAGFAGTSSAKRPCLAFSAECCFRYAFHSPYRKAAVFGLRAFGGPEQGSQTGAAGQLPGSRTKYIHFKTCRITTIKRGSLDVGAAGEGRRCIGWRDGVVKLTKLNRRV